MSIFIRPSLYRREVPWAEGRGYIMTTKSIRDTLAASVGMGAATRMMCWRQMVPRDVPLIASIWAESGWPCGQTVGQLFGESMVSRTLRRFTTWTCITALTGPSRTIGCAHIFGCCLRKADR